MDSYSNLTLFCQNSPYFGGKLTSFVAFLAQNTCVYGYRPILHYYKVNISLLGRFTKPKMGIMNIFYSNLTVFYQANPHFGGKPPSFVAFLAQNSCGIASSHVQVCL